MSQIAQPFKVKALAKTPVMPKIIINTVDSFNMSLSVVKKCIVSMGECHNTCQCRIKIEISKSKLCIYELIMLIERFLSRNSCDGDDSFVPVEQLVLRKTTHYLYR